MPPPDSMGASAPHRPNPAEEGGMTLRCTRTTAVVVSLRTADLRPRLPVWHQAPRPGQPGVTSWQQAYSARRTVPESILP